jgi:uncharacterized YigZ family protein
MSGFTYHTVAAEASSDFRDRGSKFFGFVFPVNTAEEAKLRLQELKKLHPKAVHHCFAWRLGPSGELLRANDDGEPSGSAGKPIEGQILSRGLTNVLVVVVRYFGGTLLGVPGLINAYKTAAAMALEQAGSVERKVEHRVVVQFEYTRMNQIMQAVKQFDIRLGKQEMGLYCLYELWIPLEHKEQALKAVAEWLIS